MNGGTATAIQLTSGNISGIFSEIDMTRTIKPAPDNIGKSEETRHFAITSPTRPRIETSTRESLAILNQTSFWNQQVFKRLPFPARWEAEGIERPNLVSKKESLSVLEKLLKEHQLIPISIAASIEEGICITYNHVSGWQDKSLIIEVYNDLNIALIVTDNKKKEIIYGQDIHDGDFEAAVEAYKDYRG
jgi:hypothetical protein